MLKINTLVRNNGEIDASNVNWSISLDGGAFIGKETTGKIDIPAGEGVMLSSNLILGFGPTKVKVKASIPESSDIDEVGGYVLFFFVKVNPGGGI